MKFHKLPLLTRDVTGRHYRPVLSDVSLPRLSERRRGLKFRLSAIQVIDCNTEVAMETPGSVKLSIYFLRYFLNFF